MQTFTLSQFASRFPTSEDCLEEVRKLRYPNGIHCPRCKKITTHYKIATRPSYACKNCRHQTFPLSGTVFEKSSTPLSLWFYGMFLLTQTRAEMSIVEFQHELGVTYKTAWRMYRALYTLMEQNEGDLLIAEDSKQNTVHKWVFFNKIEIRVAQKKSTEK